MYVEIHDLTIAIRSWRVVRPFEPQSGHQAPVRVHASLARQWRHNQ